MLPEQLLDSTRVVGLFVGDDSGAQPVDACRAQLRRELVPGRATVDENRRRMRRLEEDRVALADIENRDPQAEWRGPCASAPLLTQRAAQSRSRHHAAPTTATPTPRRPQPPV